MDLSALNSNEIKILETGILLLGTFLLSLLVRNVIHRFAKITLSNNPRRRRVITKSFNILLFLIALIILSIIWGIDQREILVFASSIFAIIGVALFAQWSILSNITAGIIIFFSFPYRIGDKIKILNKDYPVEGVIEDIALFYLFIKDDNGYLTTIPNNLVLQNGITKLDKV